MRRYSSITLRTAIAFLFSLFAVSFQVRPAAALDDETRAYTMPALSARTGMQSVFLTHWIEWEEDADDQIPFKPTEYVAAGAGCPVQILRG
jgi:hypothetical protein